MAVANRSTVDVRLRTFFGFIVLYLFTLCYKANKFISRFYVILEVFRTYIFFQCL